jgi:hypothetical protein
LKPNLKKKKLGMNRGPRWVFLMKKKNRGGKSRETVPVNILGNIISGSNNIRFSGLKAMFRKKNTQEFHFFSI